MLRSPDDKVPGWCVFSKAVLFSVVLSGAAILILLALGMPRGHGTTFNYAWSLQYSQTLSFSDPLPRYMPGLLAGFGGQDFFFYPPMAFWLIGAFVAPLCVGCASSTELLLGVSLMLVASGVTMFAFLRGFFATRPAAFGAVLYALLPYHLLIDWFQRQAVAEFATYAFLPLVALGVERIRRQEAGGWILSLGVAATAFSHLPTTLLAGHVFAVLILVLAFRAPAGSRLALLGRWFGYGLLGLALAAVFWLPAILLLPTVSPEALFSPHFEAWRWLYGRGTPQPNTDFAFHILVSFLAVLPLLLLGARFARGPVLAWILVPVLAAVVLTTAPSEPIWRGWILSMVQFPWRVMTLVDLSVGIAAAVLASRTFDRKGRLFLGAAALALVAGSAFLAAHVRFAPPGTTPEQNYRPWFAAVEYLSPEMTATLRARLGKATVEHFDQGAISGAVETMAAEFAAGQNGARVLEQRARSLTVEAPPGATVLSLPVQYWEFWQAKASNGTALEVRPNPSFGTLDILAPAGGFDGGAVTVALPLQPGEWAGAALSLLALVVLIAVSGPWRYRFASDPARRH